MMQETVGPMLRLEKRKVAYREDESVDFLPEAS